MNVINLLGGPQGMPVVRERLAGASGIVPGNLVSEQSGEVVNNAGAAQAAQKLFALPNLAISGDIDREYVAGEAVSYGAFHAGQEVWANVAAGAAAIADGGGLESAGDGTLRAAATNDGLIAFAIEAVDNSSGLETVRIKVRVY